MLNLDICKISCHLLHKKCVSRTCPITLRTHLVHIYFWFEVYRCLKNVQPMFDNSAMNDGTRKAFSLNGYVTVIEKAFLGRKFMQTCL